MRERLEAQDRRDEQEDNGRQHLGASERESADGHDAELEFLPIEN
jgi:hypothetical protein